MKKADETLGRLADLRDSVDDITSLVEDGYWNEDLCEMRRILHEAEGALLDLKEMLEVI